MKDKIINYIKDIFKEMKKVSWPKKQELIDSVKIVVITMFIFAAVVYAIDKGLEAILKLIFTS